MAIRIIVPSIADCYEALGIVHKKYRPLIGRIKDYISLPKPNGYKSIHTTIFGPEGKILEVQIRTERLHDEAEFGIAAHWIYSNNRNWKDYFSKPASCQRSPKGNSTGSVSSETGRKRQAGNRMSSGSLLRSIFSKTIFLPLHPRGDVIEMPENATPVDFAYRIHSEVGDRTTGARINGKMVPLDHGIQNGDVVDIITAKNKRCPAATGSIS